jgi:hypothetical protein
VHLNKATDKSQADTKPALVVTFSAIGLRFFPW